MPEWVVACPVWPDSGGGGATRRRPRSSSSSASLFAVLGARRPRASSATSSALAASAPVARPPQADRPGRVVGRLRRRRLAARLHPVRHPPHADPGQHDPADVKDATVAIEDERFYKHKGVDAEGVVRAAIKNIESRQDRRGRLDADDAARPHALHHQGADVQAQGPRGQARRGARERPRQGVDPQQVHQQRPVRHASAARPRSASRPRRACSSTSPPTELELHEAALLAGLPQAPSQYNPFNAPDAALRRRNQVLDKMAELRMITPQPGRRGQGARARRRAQPASTPLRRESFFFDYVRQDARSTSTASSACAAAACGSTRRST